MKIITAVFHSSSPDLASCPKSALPEFALIGRSNVGKSSLINMLTRSEGLAKVSQIPGKTQLINFFTINNTWSLVDLPGYGYAKVGKQERSSFSAFVADYLQHRPKRQARTPGDKPRTSISVDDQVRIAREAIPGFEPQLVNLAGRGASATILGKTGGILAREHTSWVVIDTATGAVIEKFRQTEAPPGNKLYFLVEPLHYGAFGGAVVKAIYLLLGMTGAFLSITGFILWWRKRRNQGRKVCAESSLQHSLT